MSQESVDTNDNAKSGDLAPRRMRADAQRSIELLLAAAKAVFASSGVDAPVREIAERAGVGIGTLYRNFPERADLVAAVFRQEIDACADAAPVFAAEYPPFEALAKWLQRYAQFIVTKRGLAKVLYSGAPAFEALPALFDQRLKPACRSLFEAAAQAGTVRTDLDPDELLNAVAGLCMSTYSTEPDHAQRMVGFLIDGLRRKPDGAEA